MQFIKKIVLPPGLFVATAFTALLLRRRYPRLARAVLLSSLGGLFLLSQPFVSTALMRSLQPSTALPPANSPTDVDAVVILAAGLTVNAPEQAGATVDSLTLERLRYGAQVARRAELPVLVAGGQVRADAPPLAQLMRAVLEDELGVAVAFVEDQSLNTRENARHTAELLRAAGLDRIVLVTHAFHMPRARRAFEVAGLIVTEAPTAFRAWPRWDATSFVPSGEALQDSHWALHEWLGRLWYRIEE